MPRPRRQVTPHLFEHAPCKNCYRKGCGCPDCLAAQNAAQRLTRSRQREEDWPYRRVDPTAARQHIIAMRRQGIGIVEIARQAKTTEGVILRIKRGQVKFIHLETERKILKVGAHTSWVTNPFKIKEMKVRLTWLHDHGYSDNSIADVSGIHRETIRRIRSERVRRVDPWVYEQIQALHLGKFEGKRKTSLRRNAPKNVTEEKDVARVG